MTTLQKSLVTATLALSLGFGLYEALHVARLQGRLAAIEQTNTQTRLAHELRLADLTAELARLRAEADRLRADVLAAAQAQAADVAAAQDPEFRAMNDWLERVRTLKAHIKAHPEATIPEMQWLEDADWLDATKNTLLADEMDFRRASALLRGSAETKFAQKTVNALLNYLPAHDGQFPTDVAQLAPCFFPPVDPAVLERWVVKPTQDMPSLDVGGDSLITQKSLIDEELDARTGIGPNRFRSAGTRAESDFKDIKIINSIVRAYLVTNPTRGPLNFDELTPYATTPEQKSALRKRIETNRWPSWL